MNIREHLDVFAGGESYFSNVRGALSTKMPRGRPVSICDFKGWAYLFVFALSPWFWASLL